MRKTVITLPVPRPRNGVVRALIGKLNFGAGRHKAKIAKRKQATDDTDLANGCVRSVSGESQVHSPVAQWVERRTVNADVRGSYPRWGAINLKAT